MIYKIMSAVMFMAVGGLFSIVFFFLFGHSILGISKLQQQLKELEDKASRTNQILDQIKDSIQKK